MGYASTYVALELENYFSHVVVCSEFGFKEHYSSGFWEHKIPVKDVDTSLKGVIVLVFRGKELVVVMSF